MAEDKKDGAAEAPPKKSNKMLIIIIAAVVLLGGGGAGAFFMLKGGSAEAAPTKGIVTSIDDAFTVNLADGHYLKLKFALQQTADSGSEAVDVNEALNLAIDEYTGMTVAALSTEKGRDAAKADLLAKLIKAYTKDGTKEVMDVYYTQFVTQ